MMIRLLIALAALLMPAVAFAQVDVRFYSRDFGSVSAHGFFEVEGTGGTKRNHGFIARTVTPAILMTSVAGKIIEMEPGYVSRSALHFALHLNDDQYRRLMGVVAAWGGKTQTSYNLYNTNCVSFIRDALQSIGLRTNPYTRFIGKPKSFLNEVQALNPGLKR